MKSYLKIEGHLIAVSVVTYSKDGTELPSDLPAVEFSYLPHPFRPDKFFYGYPLRWRNTRAALRRIWSAALDMLPAGTDAVVVSALDNERLHQYLRLAQAAGYRTALHWDAVLEESFLTVQI